MNLKTTILLCCIFLTLSAGCAYRHYLGMHGPSIRAFPEIHKGMVKDEQCLDCHHPDRAADVPATTHPDFTGCLKCHNDIPVR